MGMRLSLNGIDKHYGGDGHGEMWWETSDRPLVASFSWVQFNILILTLKPLMASCPVI